MSDLTFTGHDQALRCLCTETWADKVHVSGADRMEPCLGLLVLVEESTRMTDKSNFTPDEWKVLLESGIAAGVAVTAAEPSGLWGFYRRALPVARR